MTKKIKKKVVWITGGGTGIGKELAKLFSDNNYIVVISGRRISKLNEVKSYNTKNINSIKLDVSNHKECSRAVKLIIKKFNSIDLIFLNAATYNPGPLDELDQIKIKRIVNTNVIGPINCLSPALELMKKKKTGHIVFVSSPAGFRGLPGAGMYGVTKSAITFLAETLNIEYSKHNIKVQVIHPGFVKTAMTDKNTFPMPFIISAEKAAQIIMKKINLNSFEISFPKRLILPMKLLRILPYSIYFFLMKNFVKNINE